jgi:DNA-binding transcriptional LysR family regulator
VAAPALLAEIVAPVLAELLLRHVALRVEVVLEQHGEPGAACDLALRLGPLPDSARLARRLGELRAGLYASPGYLARRGTPHSASDLGAHERIVLAEPGSDEVWFLGQGRASRAVQVEGRLRVASLRAGQAAARAGLGIVRLPAALVADDLRNGLLVQLLPADTASGVPVLAVRAGGRHVPAKVRALLDLLEERRPALPWAPR